MKSRTAKNGTKIPVLGLGTWGIGGNTSAVSRIDEEHIRAQKAALELGYTHIDTAA